ncbi:MAG: radical SAM protein [bacterium]
MGLLELQKDIIYGPVNSRRLGRSLGVNLLPTHFKICSFNCCYCQYGWTSAVTNRGEEYATAFPSLSEVTHALRSVMHGPTEFDYITFCGNGEPTLHPVFSKIVDAALDLKSLLRPNTKLALLSNGSMCGNLDVKAALKHIDLPILKLDAGNERAFKRMNHGHPPVTLHSIIETIKALDKYVLQTMFVRGSVDNSTDIEVDSWIEKLRELAPLWVQIYSVDRGTAHSGLKKVQPERLRQIADLAQKTTGLKVEIF